jgi:hypothetical protein
MKPLLAGGSGRVGKWLIVGALAFAVAPAPARAQGTAPPAAAPRDKDKAQRLEVPRLAGAALFGLPTKDGRVQWPFGLESLTPSEESGALRNQLELVLDVVAQQATEGQVNGVLINFGVGAVHDLRQMMRQSKGTMHPKTYAEAERFLDRAERGLTRLKGAEAGPPKIKTVETTPGGARPAGPPERQK